MQDNIDALRASHAPEAVALLARWDCFQTLMHIQPRSGADEHTLDMLAASIEKGFISLGIEIRTTMREMTPHLGICPVCEMINAS